jgi:hypothetical protein
MGGTINDTGAAALQQQGGSRARLQSRPRAVIMKRFANLEINSSAWSCITHNGRNTRVDSHKPLWGEPFCRSSPLAQRHVGQETDPTHQRYPLGKGVHLSRVLWAPGHCHYCRQSLDDHFWSHGPLFMLCTFLHSVRLSSGRTHGWTTRAFGKMWTAALAVFAGAASAAPDLAGTCVMTGAPWVPVGGGLPYAL